MFINKTMVPCINCGCIPIGADSALLPILRFISKHNGCRRIDIIVSQKDNMETTVYRIRRLVELGAVTKMNGTGYNESGPSYFITRNGIITLTSLDK